MTVRELIEHLEKHPLDMEVEYECEGGRTMYIDCIYESPECKGLLVLGTY